MCTNKVDHLGDSLSCSCRESPGDHSRHRGHVCLASWHSGPHPQAPQPPHPSLRTDPSGPPCLTATLHPPHGSSHAPWAVLPVHPWQEIRTPHRVPSSTVQRTCALNVSGEKWTHSNTHTGHGKLGRGSAPEAIATVPGGHAGGSQITLTQNP